MELSKLLHLIGAIVWLGGMTALTFAARPAALEFLEGSLRAQTLHGMLRRFFVLVWLSIALLLASGLHMLGVAGKAGVVAPAGWHAMTAIGVVMMLIFGHLYFVPFKRLARAVAAGDWPSCAPQLALIHKLVVTNWVLGWCAIGAVKLLK
jgi:uncharacterized membrane protein